MAPDPQTGLTYDDLQRFPDDGLRRELIDGELFVTPSPNLRHQRVVLELGSLLLTYAKQRGGTALVAPFDVYFSQASVVEPDVLFVRPEHAGRLEDRFVRSAPDLVAEVSSPSTRRTDQVRKRDLYERHGVPEYWFVDLDAERVEVHRLQQGRYGTPALLVPGDTLTSPLLDGLAIPVADLLVAGPPPS